MKKNVKLMSLVLACSSLAVAACGNDDGKQKEAESQVADNSTISSKCGENFKLGDFAKKSKSLNLLKNIAAADAASDSSSDEPIDIAPAPTEECSTYLRWSYNKDSKVLSLLVDDAQADCETIGTINFVKNGDAYDLSYNFVSRLKGDEAVDCAPNSCTYDLLLDVKDIEEKSISVNIAKSGSAVDLDLSQGSGSVKIADRTNCY